MSNDSLPKQLPQLELGQTKARSWEISQSGAAFQSFEPPLTAFPGHRQGAEWEADLWPGNAVQDGLNLWHPKPAWETQRKLLDPAFGLAQLKPLWQPPGE